MTTFRSRESVRVGCWAGAWGDTLHGAAALVESGQLDFLVGDYLAEVTMALLARRKQRDASGGYIDDALLVLRPLLHEISRRGIRVVTNAGALNPLACRDALEAAAREAGVPLRVAAVVGDDLTDRPVLPALRPLRADDVPPTPLTANAYLGARPIARALDLGADVVVTGRCVDSALVLGPLMHSFGWADTDYDLLSAGTLAGHVVECGAQATGGQHTDWDLVPGWDDVGMPIIDVDAAGVTIVTKTPGTGGLVVPATVTEQMLYEIGDPGAYVMPDVVCDWRDVRIEQAGEDAVVVYGAVGRAPTTSYKVTATTVDGYRITGIALYTGRGAALRARRVGTAVIARTNRLLAEQGGTPLARTSVEVIGGGDVVGDAGLAAEASEVILKLAAHDPRKDAVDLLARELIPAALSMAQGMAAGPGGRPRTTPAIAVHSLLVEKTALDVHVELDGERVPVEVPPGDPHATTQTPELDPGGPAGAADAPLLAVRELAYARSGDKGNDANIGVIARRPEFVALLRDALTPEVVAERFAHLGPTQVRGWELPGVGALNFVLHDALGGHGGTSSLRFDPQGKTLASSLLDLRVPVPVAAAAATSSGELRG